MPERGLLEDHPACEFAKVLMHVPPEEYIHILFGSVPKGSMLSYRQLNLKTNIYSMEKQGVSCVLDTVSLNGSLLAR